MEKLEMLKMELVNKQSELESFDRLEHVTEEMYDDMLDDCHGNFMGYSASEILKAIDPIAYRCGMSDYADSLEDDDFPEYVELCDAISEIEIDIADLELEIEE